MYGEIAQLTAEAGYKCSTAERRLRHSESPDILPVMGTSKKGTPYIKAYKWVGTVESPTQVILEAIKSTPVPLFTYKLPDNQKVWKL